MAANIRHSGRKIKRYINIVAISLIRLAISRQGGPSLPSLSGALRQEEGRARCAGREERPAYRAPRPGRGLTVTIPHARKPESTKARSADPRPFGREMLSVDC